MGSNLKNKKSFLKLSISILLYLVYTLVCCELLIRGLSFFVPLYDVEMLKYATKLKMRSEHPVLTHEHVPNSSARLMGVDVSLNSLGHRNQDLTPEKKEGEYRIHLIGSSISMGWGVPQEKTFATRLEQRLNENNPHADTRMVKVINAGVGNTNTVLYVEQFKLQYVKTKPDTVIMQYYINDAEIITKKPNNPIMKYFFSVAYIKQNISYFTYGLSHSGNLFDYYAELYSDDYPGWQAVKKSVQELKSITDINNMKLVILLIPDFHDFSASSPFEEIYSKVISTFEGMGIPVVNTYPSLSRRFSENPRMAWVAKDDAHPNAQAHGIIASDLSRYFLSEDVSF